VKLGLGTVQFGIDYGVSNSVGQTPLQEVRNILVEAAKVGVRVIDTAALYGTSEEVLGQALWEGHKFAIVTKTVKISNAEVGPADVDDLYLGFQDSLTKLQQSAVYGLLLHDADDLLKPGGHYLWDCMLRLKEEGKVQKIGISVYTAQQIEAVLAIYQIDLIQLPINVLDQRLLRNGQLAALKAAGVEIHARSAFLQGVLLMPIDRLPTIFKRISPLLQDYQLQVQSNGLTLVESALAFVSSLSQIDAVVCGVNTCGQFCEIASAISDTVTVMDFSAYAIEDIELLNPAKWNSV
jgi:aryl-alcohol dehydrogenase-like predicted oxidoreductase